MSFFTFKIDLTLKHLIAKSRLVGVTLSLIKIIKGNIEYHENNSQSQIKACPSSSSWYPLITL